MIVNKTIVYHPDDWTNLNAPFLVPIWKEAFNIEPYEKNKTYNPKEHIFWTGCLNKNIWYKEYYDCGHKVIIDHLWESNLDESTTIENNILTLRCKNWIWYNESLWYKSLGYEKYIPEKDLRKSFLMLMNIQKPHRDQIFNQVNLNDALYSYVDRNILISEDMDHTMHWQRYMAPSWYNQTAFSVVVETFASLPTFISEKTFKPLAYYHPFILWGSPYTLKYLHELEFRTFPHVIDESYDSILDDTLRLHVICQQINELCQNYKTIFQDRQTQEILKHNHNLFFNASVLQRFKEEIVEQVLKFIE